MSAGVNDPVEVRRASAVSMEDLRLLYSSVGWVAYTADVESLARAVTNSTYVVEARVGESLIGLARGMSDDVSIFYLQDILVRPDWQHQGVGRALLADCLERFGHVRQKVLLTDDLLAQHRFYEAMGYTDTRDITNASLHTFVRIEGMGSRARAT
jgi:GNAT superfamily N-acetyltransferase